MKRGRPALGGAPKARGRGKSPMAQMRWLKKSKRGLADDPSAALGQMKRGRPALGGSRVPVAHVCDGPNRPRVRRTADRRRGRGKSPMAQMRWLKKSSFLFSVGFNGSHAFRSRLRHARWGTSPGGSPLRLRRRGPLPLGGLSRTRDRNAFEGYGARSAFDLPSTI